MKRRLLLIVLPITFILFGCGTGAESESATCNSAGVKTYWPSGPTCLGAANYNVYCAVCGKHLESGTDPALPHTEVATVEQQGNCSVLTQISYDCEVCGSHLRRESYYEDEHEWITGEGEIFNTATLEWEKVSTTYCSRCGGGRFIEKD